MHLGFIKTVGFRREEILVGLDVGTSKVCAVVGETSSSVEDTKSRSPKGVSDRSVNVIGVGIAPSKGIKKGVVINIEDAVESINAAVRDAETMAGVDIKAVQTGITGGHIQCLSSSGVIAVKEKEINQKEIERVIDAARAVAIPFDRNILHVIPTGFSIDGENGITDPRGMGGVRLETDVQIITGGSTSVRNLIKSCQNSGLEVIDVVFQPLASAEAVLVDDEKELGTVVVDIGAGTTDIALFQEGNLSYSTVLAIGGSNFTNDIAIGLRIPTRDAENLKKKYGCTMMSLVHENDEIEIGFDDGRRGRRIPRRYLIEIIQPRAEELLGLIREEIIGNGFHKSINSGVVLTGGAVLMEGMDVMAENILELPVRIGSPVGVVGNIKEVSNPMHSTGIGLLLYGNEGVLLKHKAEAPERLTGVKSRMKGWFSHVF
jgi:cell division protein FtsA